MGGAEIQIKYLVSYLVEKGVEVHFVFEDKGISYNNSLGINLYPLKKINLSKRFGNRWFFYQKRIKELLHQIQPDAIYTRFYSSWSGFAAMYSKKDNIPHVWAIASDNDLLKDDISKSFYKVLDRIEDRIVIKAFANATHIIVQNERQKKELQNRYNRKGILLTQAAPIVQTNEIVKEEGKIKVVWVANLKQLKRPELFLKIADAFTGNPEFEFIMIGRPHASYLEQIKQSQAKNENFSYLGELSNNAVNTVLLCSHILINTSDYEGFSNTFVQAWLRKVVVISMNSNPDNILTTQNIGYLLPETNQIEQTLIEFSNYRQILKKMGDDAFNYAREHHNLDNNLQKVTELLNLNS